MIEKYPFIKNDVKIIKKYSSVAIKHGMTLVPINESAFEILRECDGSKTFQELFLHALQKYCHKNEDIDDFLKKTEMFFQNLSSQDMLDYADAGFCREPNITDVSKWCYPDNVVFELTDHCNLNCRHCYRGSNSSKNSYIDKERMLSVVGALAEYGLKSIHLTGGEPTTHPDFGEIFVRALEVCPRVIILSNGTCFTKQHLELFAQYKDRIKIQVDLDGPNAQIHDNIRGKSGAFDAVTAFISDASKQGVPVEIAMDVCQYNLDTIGETLELARQLGAGSFNCNPIMEAGRGKNLAALNDEQTERFIRSILDLEQKYVGFMGKLDTDGSSTAKRKNCGGGHRNIVCSPEGWIRPCILLPTEKMVMGNLLTEDMGELFSRPIFKWFADLQEPKEDICGNCSHVLACKSCFSRPFIMEEKWRDENGDFRCEYRSRYFPETRNTTGYTKI